MSGEGLVFFVLCAYMQGGERGNMKEKGKICDVNTYTDLRKKEQHDHLHYIYKFVCEFLNTEF